MKIIHIVVVCSFILSANLLSVLAQVQPECYPTADVVFLLDGSDSISNSEFQQQLELMIRFVNNTNIGPDKVRVGFAVISSSVGDAFPLFASINRDIVMAAINNVTQPQEGSRTDLGLVQMEQMFGFQGRPGVLRIGVIMTDGRAKFEKATEVEASVVKSSGIFLVAIGVGRLIKFSELEKIASTPSNAYRLIPLDLSSTLLSGTVEVLGRESCAGHAAALMDLLKTETNPSAKQMAGLPFNALSDQMRHGTTGVQNSVNPDIPATNSNLPQQTHVNGMNFLDNPVYNILNASVPQLQSHSAGNNIEQIPTTTTTVATTINVNSHVTDPRPFITTGLGINFNGGIADPNIVVEAVLPDNILRPETLPTSGSGSNPGVPFQFSDRNIQVPVARESMAANVIADKHPFVPIISDITTPPPVREVSWPKSRVPQDQCSKGRYVNGVRHTFVPESCTDFVLCREDVNGKIQMEVARCPFETFYDDKNAVCKYYEELTCWRDPCFNQYADSYTHPGNCRAYWSCSSGSSVPMCCPLGSSFARGVGCVRNTSCQDTCMDFGNIKTVIASTKCRLLPMESNNQFFFEKVSGMGWMVRSCPPGSKFDHNICNCVTPDKVFKPSCRPELYLTFEEGVVDKSGNHLAMGNKNVRLDLGSGQFDGNAHLTMWRFSGVSFGQKVKITFRFRTSVWAPKGRLMHVVSNCCFGCEGIPQPSVDIAIIPGDNGGIAVFSASTSTAGENFVYVQFTDTFTGWNRLTYTYDGKALTGTVNSATESKNIIGDILDDHTL